MDELRDQCPWDRKQTIHSLRNLSIEEVYELVDAITREDWTNIKEELGDVMLHLLFYARLGTEAGHFTLEEVLNTQCEKLIRRHPHIYGDVKADTEEQVKQNWEKIKMTEGKKSVLQGVPAGLPALIKALRMQDKAAQVGFQWDRTEEVWSKLKEEMAELEAEMHTLDQDALENEFGDVLFSLINLARYLHIDPEKPKKLEDMTLAEMDKLWNEAKHPSSDQK